MRLKMTVEQLQEIEAALKKKKALFMQDIRKTIAGYEDMGLQDFNCLYYKLPEALSESFDDNISDIFGIIENNMEEVA